MKATGIVSWLVLTLVLLGGPVDSLACHWCNCLTTASSNGGTILICPAGDGPALSDINAQIEVLVREFSGEPVVGMPAEDFWIASPTLTVALCGSWQSSMADGPTDAQGMTTISGSVAAGGFSDNDAYVIASGWPIQSFPECDSPLPLVMVSPDMNGDLAVNLVDAATFASSFPPNPYAKQADMDGDGVVALVDLALFATHWGHVCSE